MAITDHHDGIAPGEPTRTWKRLRSSYPVAFFCCFFPLWPASKRHRIGSAARFSSGPFNAFAFTAVLGGIGLFMIAAPKGDVSAVIRLGIPLEILIILIELARGWPVSRIASLFGLGLAASAGIRLCAPELRDPARRSAYIDCLASAAVLPLCALVLPFFLTALSVFISTVYDPVLMRIDAVIGIPAGLLVGYWFIHFPILAYLCAAVYVLLPLPAGLLAGLEARFGTPLGTGLIPMSLLAAVLGYALYYTMPAIGPLAFTVPGFPCSRRTLQSFRRI